MSSSPFPIVKVGDFDSFEQLRFFVILCRVTFSCILLCGGEPAERTS